MAPVDLLALRPGTDGDGFDVHDVLLASDRPNMPAGMSGSDPIRMCSYCRRGEFNGHSHVCKNVRLSTALTAGAQAMERWETLKAHLADGQHDEHDGSWCFGLMADLERGEQ